MTSLYDYSFVMLACALSFSGFINKRLIPTSSWHLHLFS